MLRKIMISISSEISRLKSKISKLEIIIDAEQKKKKHKQNDLSSAKLYKRTESITKEVFLSNKQYLSLKASINGRDKNDCLYKLIIYWAQEKKELRIRMQWLPMLHKTTIEKLPYKQFCERFPSLVGITEIQSAIRNRLRGKIDERETFFIFQSDANFHNPLIREWNADSELNTMYQASVKKALKDIKEKNKIEKQKCHQKHQVNIEAIQQSMAIIQKKLSLLEAEKKTLTKELGIKKNQLSVIQKSESYSKFMPEILKLAFFPTEKKAFYSLRLDKSLLFYFDGDYLSYIYSARVSEAFIIKKIEASPATKNLVGDIIQKVSGKRLNKSQMPSVFISHNQILFFGEGEKWVASIFQQVSMGVKIFPKPSNPNTLLVRGETNKDSMALMPRHWGQDYLSKKNPDSIVLGELYASGCSYKVFFFGKKAIVEFDQEKRSTFLFDSSYFKTLRNWSRSEIISQNPQGFLGRVIHKSRKQWETRVEEFFQS